MRHEERRRRDRQHVVEHLAPGREERPELVERVARERRGPAGLGEHRGRLGVRRGGQEEDEPRDDEDDRGEPERERRHQAERVVDRRADVAVRARGERVDAEDALEAFESALSHRPVPARRCAVCCSSSAGTGFGSAGLGVRSRQSAGGAVRITRHGALRDHVPGDVADEVLERAPAPPEQRPAADARGLLGGEHDRLDAAAARLAHDRLARAAGADDRGGDLDALVLLPHELRARQRLARPLDLGIGQRRIHRQRQRDLEHPDRLDHRSLGLEVVAGLPGQAAGGLDDVVVERGPEDRDEDRAELGLERLVPQRALGDRHAPQQRLLLGLAVADVQQHPAEQPRQPDVAGAGVEHQQRHPAEPRRDRADDRRHRHAGAGDRDRQRNAVRTVAVGLAEAQRDHRHVRDRERQQRAERVDPDQELEVGRQHERGGGDRGHADDHVRRAPAAVEPADRARDLPVGRERVADAGDAEHRRPGRGEQPERASDRDRVLEHVGDPLRDGTPRPRRAPAP